MKDQNILIGDNYYLKVETIGYSETYPTQVYLCSITESVALKGRNWAKGTPLSSMIIWAENQINTIEFKKKETVIQN